MLSRSSFWLLVSSSLLISTVSAADPGLPNKWLVELAAPGIPDTKGKYMKRTSTNAKDILEEHLAYVDSLINGGGRGSASRISSTNSNSRDDVSSNSIVEGGNGGSVSGASNGNLRGVGETYTIGDSFIGYSGEFSGAIIDQIKNAPGVLTVVPDSMAETNAYPTNCTVRPLNAAPDSGEWGLGRISHFPNANNPLIRAHDTYRYNPTGICTRTTAYVLDSGISRNHPEFAGRTIRWGWQSAADWPQDDVCGHGTHIAGIIGGKNYGVQPSTELVAVKALEGRPSSGNCLGPWSGVLGGITWIVQDATSKGIKGTSVVLMSLGGAYNQVVQNAIEAAADQGITFVVSAGNNGADACKQSPAASPKVITVGSTNIDDTVSSTSNRGCCVDLFAPGNNIGSAFVPTSFRILSGTSMAAPFVAGQVLYNKCRFGYKNPAEDRIGVTDHEAVIRNKIPAAGRCMSGGALANGVQCVPNVGGGCAPDKIVYNKC